MYEILPRDAFEIRIHADGPTATEIYAKIREIQEYGSLYVPTTPTKIPQPYEDSQPYSKATPFVEETVQNLPSDTEVTIPHKTLRTPVILPWEEPQTFIDDEEPLFVPRSASSQVERRLANIVLPEIVNMPPSYAAESNSLELPHPHWNDESYRQPTVYDRVKGYDPYEEESNYSLRNILLTLAKVPALMVTAPHKIVDSRYDSVAPLNPTGHETIIASTLYDAISNRIPELFRGTSLDEKVRNTILNQCEIAFRDLADLAELDADNNRIKRFNDLMMPNRRTYLNNQTLIPIIQNIARTVVNEIIVGAGQPPTDTTLELAHNLGMTSAAYHSYEDAVIVGDITEVPAAIRRLENFEIPSMRPQYVTRGDTTAAAFMYDSSIGATHALHIELGTTSYGDQSYRFVKLASIGVRTESLYVDLSELPIEPQKKISWSETRTILLPESGTNEPTAIEDPKALQRRSSQLPARRPNPYTNND